MKPTRTALYRLFDDHGELLYVGISGAWPARIREHERSRDWFNEVAPDVIVLRLDDGETIEFDARELLAATRAEAA